MKETFADGLPAEIEKVKKLRKYVDRAPFVPPIVSHCIPFQNISSDNIIAGSSVTRSLVRLPSTRLTVVPVVSSP